MLLINYSMWNHFYRLRTNSPQIGGQKMLKKELHSGKIEFPVYRLCDHEPGTRVMDGYTIRKVEEKKFERKYY